MNGNVKASPVENRALTGSNSIIEIITDTMKHNVRQFTMVIALLAIWAILTLLTNGTFISFRNLSNLFLQTATIAILAVGMVLIIVSGHIDLSVGSNVGLLGAIAGVLMAKRGFGTVSTILIVLAAGLLIGLWQGYWVAYRGVPGFIVTLSGYMAFRGLCIGVTGGNSIGPMNSSFKVIGQGYLPKLTGLPFNDTSAILGIVFILLYIVFDFRKRNTRLKYGFKVLPLHIQIAKVLLFSAVIALVLSIMVGYLGIPYAILLLMGIVWLFNFITTKTTFGRYVYAIGGNKDAARLSGINIKGTYMTVFVLMGLLCAIASIVFTARLNAATAAAGVNMELDAIAAAIIGGTSTMGGEGTIIGAIIGALVMSSLDNGMSLLNLDVTYQYVVKGLILLLAVWLDIATRKKGA